MILLRIKLTILFSRRITGFFSNFDFFYKIYKEKQHLILFSILEKPKKQRKNQAHMLINCTNTYIIDASKTFPFTFLLNSVSMF